VGRETLTIEYTMVYCYDRVSNYAYLLFGVALASSVF